ncbi:unnamed protein product [Gongylonema pulchrum]|uniref:COesterase domain-containing protein n=1 Tax=Gongylonema pulchrum TaxID=637853 RepID=A0A183EHE7_9BILA|nr:unnamed protein product [Gongylonema pulchrum]
MQSTGLNWSVPANALLSVLLPNERVRYPLSSDVQNEGEENMLAVGRARAIPPSLERLVAENTKGYWENQQFILVNGYPYALPPGSNAEHANIYLENQQHTVENNEDSQVCR